LLSLPLLFLAGTSALPGFSASPSGPKIHARIAAGEVLRGQRAAALLIDIDNPDRAFEGEIRFILRDGVTRWVHPVDVPATSKHRYHIPFYPGMPGSLQGRVDLVGTGNELLASQSPLRGTISGKLGLIGIVGKHRVVGLRTLLAQKELRTLNHLVPFDFEALPGIWEGLDPFDVLLVWGADFQRCSPEQVEALRNWVLRGGVLVAIGDLAWQAWPGTFVASVLGLELGGPVPEKGSGPLAGYTRDTQSGHPGRFNRLQAAALAEETQTLVKGTGNLNELICRGSLGRGFVIFMAFDPSVGGLRQWRGMPWVWRRLLASQLASGKTTLGEPSWTAADKYIIGALSEKAAPLPSVLWAILAVLLYGLVIGPVEFLTWKGLKRRHWTVVTFPLLVGIAGIAALMVTREVRGREVTQAEITVEDIDAPTGDSCWETYLGLYSPSAGLFRLGSDQGGSIGELARDAAVLSEKQGLPCTFGMEGSLQARLHFGGKRFFRGAGVHTREGPPLRVRVKRTEIYDEEDNFVSMEFEVEVENRLPFPLRDCLVLSGNAPQLGARVLHCTGTVKAGEKRVFSTVKNEVRRQSLHAYLTGLRRQMRDGGSDPAALLPHLAFFQVRQLTPYEEERIRRGLHQGDALHRDQKVFFTAWADEEKLHYSVTGWRPLTTMRLRWIRMRVPRSQVTFEARENE
jgi:hypothetical protein